MPQSFEDARHTILESVSSLSAERVSLLEASGRVLAEPVRAPWDMPQWDNSAMDGYAVRAQDCGGEATLKVTGYIPAGATGEGIEVAPGSAVKIMTGAPIPKGADSIVPVEDTEESEGVVTIGPPVRKGDHIRFRGEDIQTGQLVMEPGILLRPPEINMLATFGQGLVPVYRRVRVAILSTGDELVELGQPAGPGQIVNSNTFSLAAAVKEIGGEPILLGIARDEPDSLREKITAGLDADVLITSAGVSAGDRDFVREILEESGVRQLFWKVNIKPGRPTAFGMKGRVPVFSLPGNPVSTMVTFEMFVRPALLKMMGHQQVIKPYLKAILQEPAKKKAGRLHFLRVQVTTGPQGYQASSSGDQNTGIVRTMVRANGIAVLPVERDRIEAGEEVDVHLLNPFVP